MMCEIRKTGLFWGVKENKENSIIDTNYKISAATFHVIL